MANLITIAGADRVLTMDLHAGQIQGFFDIPVDNLYAVPVIEQDIRKNYDIDKLMIISPDVGGVVRARQLAKRINADIAIVDKRRPEPGKAEVMNIIGDVEGRRCLLFDDIVDSGGTLVQAAEALLEEGAAEVSGYISHGVLSNGAVKKIDGSRLTKLAVSDSIDHPDEVKKAKKIREISVAPLIGEAIRRIANEESVSKLFD